MLSRLIVKRNKFCILKVPLFKYVKTFIGKRHCQTMSSHIKAILSGIVQCYSKWLVLTMKVASQTVAVQYVAILSTLKTSLQHGDALGCIYDDQNLQTGTMNKYTLGSFCQKNKLLSNVLYFCLCDRRSTQALKWVLVEKCSNSVTGCGEKINFQKHVLSPGF